MMYKQHVHHLNFFKTCSIASLLALLQVLIVVYGPLVRERENSVEKNRHNMIILLVPFTYHIPKRHPHYDYNHDTEMMDNPHN